MSEQVKQTPADASKAKQEKDAATNVRERASRYTMAIDLADEVQVKAVPYYPPAGAHACYLEHPVYGHGLNIFVPLTEPTREYDATTGAGKILLYGHSGMKGQTPQWATVPFKGDASQGVQFKLVTRKRIGG